MLYLSTPIKKQSTRAGPSYQGSRPSSFRQENVLVFWIETYIKCVTPGVRRISAPGSYFNVH